MIEISDLCKSFDNVTVLNKLNLTVRKGSVYGLVGTNGAGKTTIIKHITGVLRADSGYIRIDGEDVFDNAPLKAKMGFIPDELYFFAGYTIGDTAKFYKAVYPNWNNERYLDMVSKFGLDGKKRLSKLSKGTQKRVAFVLAMSIMPEYLILDEPFDGLDPIIRKLVWKYIIDDVAEREMSALVSSHNLRELEGICDHVGIISNGAMSAEQDLDELKSQMHKVQAVFKDNERPKNPYGGLDVLHVENRGKTELLIIRNPKDEIESAIAKSNPVFFDILPLSLEEIFIYELGGEGNESIIF